MFKDNELKILYVAMLKKFEATNNQILNYTTLLSNCKDKYEAIYDETEFRLLALKSQAEEESKLLTKIFAYWKKGGSPDEKVNEKKKR